MNNFFTFEEIEKYLYEIFADNTNVLENKKRFYEKF